MTYSYSEDVPAYAGAGSTPDAVVKRVKVGDQQCNTVASVSGSNDVNILDEAAVIRAENSHADAGPYPGFFNRGG